ncbi:MAG: EamA family transporter [Dehalococcoidia bacterium]
MGILLGLAAAVCWGTSDFLGGRFSTKYPAFTVGLASHSTSLLMMLALIGVVRPELHGEPLAWGLAAGLFTSFGGVSLYKGLASADAAVVAPLSGCGAVVPVVFAFVSGDSPSGMQTVGIVLALAGAVLVSLPQAGVRFTSSHHLQPVMLGLGAAVGFGLFFVLVDQGTTTDGSALLVLASARSGGVIFTATAGALTGTLRWPRGDVLRLASVGGIDISANAGYALATTRGNVAVASVLASLYPLQTLVLARTFTDERFTFIRIAGAALALAGVAAIAWA